MTDALGRAHTFVRAVRYSYVGVLAVILCLLFSTATRATEADAGLLKKMAAMLRENRGSIRCWQGKADMETSSVEKVPLQPSAPEGRTGVFKRKTVATFWYSADLEATRWTVSAEDRYYDDKGEPISSIFRETYDEMVKGRTLYRYRDYFKVKGGKSVKGLTIWSADKARQGGISSSFDPMWFFTHDGHDTIEKLDVYSVLVANGRKDIAVRQEGQLVVLQEDFEEGKIRHVFDLARGGNQVEYLSEITTGLRAGTRRETWSYQKAGGAWVPVAWSSTRNGCPDGTVTFTESRVNEPIAPSEFTLEGLGVRNGDPVSDTVARLAYRYGATNDLLPDDPFRDTIPGPARDPNLLSLDDRSKKPTAGDGTGSSVLPVAVGAEAGGTNRVRLWGTISAAIAASLLAIVAILRMMRRNRGSA